MHAQSDQLPAGLNAQRGPQSMQQQSGLGLGPSWPRSLARRGGTAAPRPFGLTSSLSVAGVWGADCQLGRVICLIACLCVLCVQWVAGPGEGEEEGC